ncbi:SDR family oxidoreductase [Labrenzia sp. VG12]|uniref:SDR family oxidoreductase n=1 Tax=Labrenzia sp. VG12 TaxID=2021862 RepID=UPI000B8BC4CC|nr:SDR family oxidoreductase [Labrenzia sp. VG12]ASP35363.1 hypothetical protein CHH27_20725 [Labrenzia sp. VG12]
MKKAVVLGAYGFIGAACVRALQAGGFAVLGVGRSRETAQRTFPNLVWIIRDIAATPADDWQDIFADADVVVNASGALQDGARDNLTAIHETAIEQMLIALSVTRTKFIQISAAGVSEDAPTAFFRTKARGDALVTASSIDWVVLRPALVLGSDANGGSALLRAAAATPWIGARAFPQAQIQTIHVEDLAQAVVQAAGGEVGLQFVADLTEDNSHSFHALTRHLRTWLGYPDWTFEIPLPGWLLKTVGRGADLLGWLGWRSPLRTNALVSLENGIKGDPTPWRERGGIAIKGLKATLAAMPATAQERAFARLYLLLPLAIASLSLFWFLSGVIGLLSFSEAKAVLTDRGGSAAFASVAVVGGAVVDMVLGAGVLVRRWTRLACLGMIAVSAAYLFFGTLLAADLWADPLGPFVKVLPAIVLALLVALLLEKR